MASQFFFLYLPINLVDAKGHTCISEPPFTIGRTDASGRQYLFDFHDHIIAHQSPRRNNGEPSKTPMRRPLKTSIEAPRRPLSRQGRAPCAKGSSRGRSAHPIRR